MVEPTPRFRWTVERYHRAIETGLFAKADKIELIEGELIEMGPIGAAHVTVVQRLTRHFMANLPGERFAVRVQAPVTLGHDCEPEPDICIAAGGEDAYEARHPGASDILLVVEVSDTTTASDRKLKVPMYARHGVVELWLVHVAQRAVGVYREPEAQRYKQVSMHSEGRLDTLRLPGISLAIGRLWPRS